MATGFADPPQVSTNVVGFKRLRKQVTISTDGTGALTLGDVRSCLPVTSADLRFLKLSCWASDTDKSLSCVFPVGSTNNLHPGDDATWADYGVPGQARANIHVTPAFDFRNYWFTSGVAAAQVIATFAQTADTNPRAIIVDVTVQYRSAVQTCPAMAYLDVLRADSDSSDLSSLM